jgi:hypothetical protein
MMRRLRLFPAALSAWLAAGCTPAQQAVIDATLARGEAGLKAANDREALILKQAPCAMSVGGYVRVLSEAEQDAVMELCGGEPGVTLQDLASMGRAIELLQDAPPVPRRH